MAVSEGDQGGPAPGQCGSLPQRVHLRDRGESAVTDFARSLPPSQRQPFLDLFGASAAVPDDEAHAVLTAIEVVEEAAASTGEPGWGETDELQDRSGWSNDDELAEPDWTADLVALIGRVGSLFLAGDVAGAAGAYERLLRVAAGAADEGWSIMSGADEAEVLREAAARYLRTLCDVTSPADRPNRLRSAVVQLSALLGPADISLAAVAGAAGPSPPDDGEQFVIDWVAALGPIADDPDAMAPGPPAPRRGSDRPRGPGRPGARLGRAGGPRAGQAYVAWVDTTVAWGKHEEASAAAAEGLGALLPSRERAALAERLATLADREGDTRAAVDARLEAWVSAPSLDRLLALVRTARNAGTEADAVASLADRAEQAGASAATRAALLVLAGRLDAAVALGAATSRPVRDALGHRGVDAVLVPALLVAGTNATSHEGFPDLVLAELLRRADHVVGLGE